MDPLLLAYAALAAVLLVNLVAVIPMHAHLLLASSLTVYIGAHLSLAQEVSEKVEQSDALALPLVAGGGLLALWLSFKYFDKGVVNTLINVYFCVIGVMCVAGLVAPLLRRVWRSREPIFRIHVPFVGALQASTADVVGALCGALASAAYGLSKTLFVGHPAGWIANNVLGIAFAVQGIERIALGQFSTAALLLSGLFAYDIVMVFYTPLMVDVATKLDGPIKLLFPRLRSDPEAQQFSLLGLGDIVVPGIALALLLRYDALQAVKRGKFRVANSDAAVAAKQGRSAVADATSAVTAAFVADPFHAISADFPKPMFNAALWAYAGGLITTVVVMVSFNHAQPALLYLVPAVLLMTVLVALCRGEWNSLLAFQDAEYVNAVIGGGSGEAAAPPSSESHPAAGGDASIGDGAPGGKDGEHHDESEATTEAVKEGAPRRRVRRRAE